MNIIINYAAELPVHGHNTWDAPATVSPEEQILFGDMAEEGADDEVILSLLGDRGQAVKAVVGHNPKTGSVTISLADPIEGFSCADFARTLWGPEAGGHGGIAGSPRDRQLTLKDAEVAAMALSSTIG